MKTKSDQLIASMLELLAAAKLAREFLPTILPSCCCEKCTTIQHLDNVIAKMEDNREEAK